MKVVIFADLISQTTNDFTDHPSIHLRGQVESVPRTMSSVVEDQAAKVDSTNLDVVIYGLIYELPHASAKFLATSSIADPIERARQMVIELLPDVLYRRRPDLEEEDIARRKALADQE